MKISNSFLIMLFIWLLGFTSFLGGPYFLFKFIFWILILPYIILTLFLLWTLYKVKKFSKFNNFKNKKEAEIIKVKAVIKE